MTKKIDNKVPVDIRIADVNDIPAKYFLHTEVITALRDVIRNDVIVHNNPVPPGCYAVFGTATDARTRALYLRAGSSNFWRKTEPLIAPVLFLLFVLAAIAAAASFILKAVL